MPARLEDTTKRPDIIPVGPSVKLISIPACCGAFRVGEPYFRRFLNIIGVPIERVYGEAYINLFSLELELFQRLLPEKFQHASSEMKSWLQMVAGLEYTGCDEKALRERISKMGRDMVQNLSRPPVRRGNIGA